MNRRGLHADCPLVLLAPYDEGIWSQLLPALRQVADVIVPPPGEEVDLASIANRVLQEIPTCFHVVGFCFGGHLALEICRQAPDRVRGLAVLNADFAPDSPTQRLIREARIDKLRAKAAVMKMPDDAYVERAVQWLVSPAASRSLPLMNRARELLAAMPLSRSLAQQQVMLDRPDNRHHLTERGASALVVRADNDRVCPRPLAEDIGRYAPHARVRVLKECGHLAPLERPTELLVILTEWLTFAAAGSSRFLEKIA